MEIIRILYIIFYIILQMYLLWGCICCAIEKEDIRYILFGLVYFTIPNLCILLFLKEWDSFILK